MSDEIRPIAQTGAEFPSTSWTLVRQAQTRQPSQAFEAVSQLCDAYWSPLYSFLRFQGDPPADAADCVQDFFASVARNGFPRVERPDELEHPDQGAKLRSFLLQALKRHRARAWNREHALKRGGHQPKISIDREIAEGRFQDIEADGLNPEEAYDRAWALTIIDGAMNRLQDWFENQGRAREYEVLKQFLSWNSGEITQAQAAQQLGCKENKVKQDVHRMRARFRKCLEAEIAQTLETESEDDAGQELEHLLEVLG